MTTARHARWQDRARAPSLVAVALLATLASGCRNRAPAADMTPPSNLHEDRPMDTQIQPSDEPTLEPGPALRPASALLAWLEASAGNDDGGRRLFRLPVVVRFEDRYRLGLGAAHIAASVNDLAPDAIALELDDTAMGIALLDQLRSRCPAGVDACAVWLDGYWGPLVTAMGGGDRGGDGGEALWPFAVLELHGMIDPTDAASARPQVEAAP